MTDARAALRDRVAEAICRDNRNGNCPCESGGMCLSRLWDDAASAAIDLVLEEAATTIAPPEMPPCRCVVWDNSGWFLECGCANNADIQEAAAWCARRNAAAEIRVLAAK